MSAAARTRAHDGWVRLIAFAGLSALAAWRYAGVEARPPTARVLAVAIVGVVAGAALLLIGGPEPGPRRAHVRAAAARVGVIVVLTVIALAAAGVPRALLLPTGWGRLGEGLHRGLATVATTLWPYPGTDPWTRLDILLPLALIPLVAAVLAFWPGDGGRVAVGPGIRRVGALGLLLALYVAGVIDSNGGSVTIEGLLLLVLVAWWLWLPDLRARRALAALVWLAAAGVVAAALVNDIAASQAWFDYRAWNLLGAGGSSTAFAWDQTYGPIPWSRSQRTMFTVRAPAPSLWKVTTLDRFDGLRFVRSGTDPTSESDLPLPLNDRWYVFARFAIQGLRSGLLPTEQGTTAAVNFRGGVRYQPDGTVGTGGGLRSGDAYTVMSYVPSPSAAELRAAPRSFPRTDLRYTDFDLPNPTQSGLSTAVTDPLHPGHFFTGQTVGAPAPGLTPAATPRVERRILNSPYGPMYRLTRGLARTSHSTYDVVMAVEKYLKANYAYSEQSPARRYPLESFLFDDRIGYCQQFSGAMALMLRMDGIPARVAAGFLPGTRDGGTGAYRVRALDAHSWVEVYFTGIGWVAFNPTPPRSVAPRPRPVFASQTAATPLDAIAATVGGPLPLARAGSPSSRRSGAGRGRGYGRWALLALAAAGVLALLLLATRWLGGHARLRRSLAGDGELATRELESALSRLGYGLPATVTLTQIERIVRLHGGPEAARYVRLLRERRYAVGPAVPASLRDRRLLRARLTAPLGLDARLRGLWALPPATLGWRVAIHTAGDPTGGP